jgi:peptidoglycan/LPS O-acetylase OafA/YrhL
MSINKETITTHTAKIPALDGVRGIAILMVMVSHFFFVNVWNNSPWFRVMQSGWLGVDLFFVLSGFLITGILLKAKGKTAYFSNFYKRRSLRIFPLYYFAIFVVWFCIVFIEKAPERLHSYDSWWWFVLIAPNIAMALKDNWTYHSNYLDANHLWSIGVEEQFYLVWPLIVRFTPAWLLAIFCALLVHFSVHIRHATDAFFGKQWSLASYMMPYCRLDGLAAGSFLAIYFFLGWDKKIPYHRWLVRGLFVWMAYRVLDQLWHYNSQYLGTISAFVSASGLYLSLNPHPWAIVRNICESRFLRHIGAFSYGLYIFHHLGHELMMRYFGTPLIQSGMSIYLAQSLYMLIAFGITYGLSRLSWWLIEQPFLKMKG